MELVGSYVISFYFYLLHFLTFLCFAEISEFSFSKWYAFSILGKSLSTFLPKPMLKQHQRAQKTFGGINDFSRNSICIIEKMQQQQ